MTLCLGCCSTQFYRIHWKKSPSLWQKKKGIGIYLCDHDHDCVTNLRFADDVLLFATSKEQLQKKMYEFKECTEKVGLRIHPGKTKVLSNQSSLSPDTKKRNTSMTSKSKYWQEVKAWDTWARWLHSSNRKRPKSSIVSGQPGRRFASTGRSWHRKTTCSNIVFDCSTQQ